MADELLIKINADAKNVTKAFEDVRDQTSDLEKALNRAALVSGVAFAALTAEVYVSVHAFEEAEKASVQLSNALQNQGIYTDELAESYKDYADAVQEATGIDNDAVIKAQAVAQTFLGQTKITEGLTFAIADLAAQTGGDLNSAAEKIARTIGTGTNAFARQGLVIAEGATEAERYAKVLDFVNAKAGGLAAELNKADGYAHALTTSFGNFQEAIGARFAPTITAARKIAIEFFDAFTKYPLLADVAASLITAGLAVSGLVAFAAAAVPAFLALSAAATALGVSLNLAFVGIPLAIGAVIAATTLLALNWGQAMAAMKAAAVATVTVVSELFSGLGKVLNGAVHLSPATIKEGIAQIKNSFAAAKEAASTTYTEITNSQKAAAVEQEKNKKEQADRLAAIEAAHQARLRAIRQGELDVIILQNQHASAALIALKTKEIETIKAIDANRSAAEVAALQERFATIKALEEQQEAEDFERKLAFERTKAAAVAEIQAEGIEVTATIQAERLAQIEATVQTEADIERQIQEETLARKIEVRNRELLEQKKYGTEYAKINRAINSDEVQGLKSAAGELVELQKSKNAQLKDIGKAAAVAQITIDTAQSAMSIYRGFVAAVPPPLGVALGVAGAAAAVAFGAEKIGAVVGAQDGGLIEGGIAGRDSVPALLAPGELVVPKRNFNDVVGAVQGTEAASNSNEILAALQSIEAKISTPQTTIIQGDVQADDSYIDSLVRKISDAIEFRNAQIFGVTA